MEYDEMFARVFPDRISKFSCDHKYISSGVGKGPIIVKCCDKSTQTSVHKSSVLCANKRRRQQPKVGKKKLFLFNAFGECFEVEPVCVLDFYVSTDFQRRGYGKELFEWMLLEEGLAAADLPIDSPSSNMLSFMEKHYHQDHPLRQSNNFVVFPDFFHHVSAFIVPRCRHLRSLFPSSLSVPPRGSSDSTHPVPILQSKRPPCSSSPPDRRCSSLSLCAKPDLKEYIEPIPKRSVDQSPIAQKVLDMPSVQTRVPQWRSRGEVGFLRQGPALRYSKQIMVTTPSLLLKGQLAVLNSGCASSAIERNLTRENSNISKFEELIPLHRARPSLLMPLWKTAGFAFGIATAFFGDEAALTCKSAVEVAIGEHYNHQIRELLADDPVSHAELLEILKEFRDKDLEKHDLLENESDLPPFRRQLSRFVKLATLASIKVSEKI
ncbi:5-demethoxyubiquinone hydroxylase mitochondrial [Taenia crassiceps]|uniref:5-demethoxyubiquinone hydroxylase mitochondrial n=1 Tax=Taenia crassiceps TaxID=6207 RepID=A0ABR4Q6Y8_9CEST